MSEVVQLDEYRRRQMRARAAGRHAGAAAAVAVQPRTDHFGTDDLVQLLGAGWQIDDAECVATIVGANPMLRAHLTGCAAAITAAFGEPCVRRIGPAASGDAIQIDFDTDVGVDRWMAGRQRVMAAWLQALPPECDELVIL